MKLSTLARQVAEFYEGGGKWTRGILKRRGRSYCALGAAGKILTLDELMGTEGNPTQLASSIRRRERHGDLTRREAQAALRKVDQLRELNRHFHRFSGRGELMSFNDHSISKQEMVKTLHRYSKWLRSQRL